MDNLGKLTVWIDNLVDDVEQKEFDSLDALTKWVNQFGPTNMSAYFHRISIGVDSLINRFDIIRIDCAQGCLYSNGKLTNGYEFASKSITEWISGFKSYEFVDL